MKMTLKLCTILALATVSFSAFAWNEVECVGLSKGKTVEVTVEESFPDGSPFKDAHLTVVGKKTDYSVTVMAWGFNEIKYTGANFDLDVNFWPDNVPQSGRTYRTTFNSTQNLNCRF